MNKVKLLTIMIPVYNEEECVNELYSQLKKVSKNLPCACEFLFINDGSIDQTLELIKQIQQNDARVSIVDLSRNYGKEIAMTAGLDYMIGDTLVIIDADLQDNPDLLPLMVREIENGYDDVYAQRTSRNGESWLKKSTSFLFYRLLAIMSSVPIQKDTGDFRMLSSKAIKALRQLGENERNMKGLFSFIGFKKKPIFYVRDERIAGKTKWNYFKLINLAIRGITAFSIKPLRIISITGLIISLISFAFLIKVVIKAIYFGDPVAGYPSMMSAILLLGGLQLLSIGVLGEYLGIVFSETKKRPIYFINDYINKNSDNSSND
ncbi:MAG TPA: glycosyltransferase family 2 protein [Flavobacterium sp.]|uniref:glycosyltransferase family 2 protein n=1 Tax=unclassified Flavobacterium TaxID=196869 RepID=UPI0025BA7563|nr:MULTISPECIES: glycosyltransferase family 2 protein [unclassified Flavobacterium]HRE79335.1 glycosyltransferase family 2 protein [Flavobacterium sp.]